MYQPNPMLMDFAIINPYGADLHTRRSLGLPLPAGCPGERKAKKADKKKRKLTKRARRANRK